MLTGVILDAGKVLCGTALADPWTKVSVPGRHTGGHCNSIDVRQVPKALNKVCLRTAS